MSVRTRWLAAFALFLVLPFVLAAQGDAGDITGIFGPVIDKAWPVIAAFLASLTLKIVALINEATRNSHQLVKWGLLYGFSLGYNLFATWAGLANVDPLTETWADGALIPAVQMAGAALIFKFGGRKVPALEPAPRRVP